jgi:hypothetical protein
VLVGPGDRQQEAVVARALNEVGPAAAGEAPMRTEAPGRGVRALSLEPELLAAVRPRVQPLGEHGVGRGAEAVAVTHAVDDEVGVEGGGRGEAGRVELERLPLQALAGLEVPVGVDHVPAERGDGFERVRLARRVPAVQREDGQGALGQAGEVARVVGVVAAAGGDPAQLVEVVAVGRERRVVGEAETKQHGAPSR